MTAAISSRAVATRVDLVGVEGDLLHQNGRGEERPQVVDTDVVGAWGAFG